MTAFAEADARLAGMHGYTPVERYLVVCENCGLVETPRRLPATACGNCGSAQTRVYVESPPGLALVRLEAKLDRLMKALEAGAVGRWQP